MIVLVGLFGSSGKRTNVSLDSNSMPSAMTFATLGMEITPPVLSLAKSSLFASVTLTPEMRTWSDLSVFVALSSLMYASDAVHVTTLVSLRVSTLTAPDVVTSSPLLL